MVFRSPAHCFLALLFAVSACRIPSPEPEAVVFGAQARALLPPKSDTLAWISLFNGQDLNEWEAKITGHEPGDNFGHTFRVEDGVLNVAYDRYETFDNRFGHLFYRMPFSHYILALEYRFVGEQAAGAPDWAFRNSGVMIHAQSPESMGKDQDFPISLEVQFLGGAGTGARPTGNLCTPGTHVVRNDTLVTEHCLPSTSKTYDGDAWVRVHVVVLGDSLIQHVVEGDTVMAYTRPQIGGGVVNGFDPAVKQDGAPLASGYIALQSESHPIEFRNVALLDLVGCMDPAAVNYRAYYVKPDASRCRYSR